MDKWTSLTQRIPIFNFKATNLTELCKFHDLSTAIIIDPLLEFETHKMGKDSIQLEGISENFNCLVRTKLQSFIKNNDYKHFYEELLALLPKKISKLLDIPTDRCRFFHYIEPYLQIIDPKNGLLLAKTTRYTRDNGMGVKILALRQIKAKEVIFGLIGPTVALTKQEESEMANSDFSITYSLKTKRQLLMVGSSAFVNHDCNPNAYLMTSGNNQFMHVVAIRTIPIWEEITVFYGKHYFGPGNEFCQCQTCEDKKQGAFQQHNKVIFSKKTPDWIAQKLKDIEAITNKNNNSLSQTRRTTRSRLSKSISQDSIRNTYDIMYNNNSDNII
uniref:SET domain-containing protein n=1 Tax=Rhabditophanes sp. KR3021 TaxID=114890 RepID=A0AC35UDK4_9BILA